MLEGYFHPSTAEYLGPIQKEPQWFKWVITFHRSLFMGTVGRYFMFLTTILTVLLTLVGAVLWFKKYTSIAAILQAWHTENKYKELHSHGGLLSTPPVLLLLVPAILLSIKSLQLVEFNDSSEDKGTASELRSAEDLGAFQQIIFPFFPAEPHEVITELGSYKLTLDPFTIVEYTPHSKISMLHSEAMQLHTGRGSSEWSLSLVGIALLLIYFTYTGIKISTWRFKRVKLLKSKPRTVCILYASESGKTMAVAYSFQNQLNKVGIKAKVSSINKFRYQEGIEQLFVFTATYGNGEAPKNGCRWQSTLRAIPQGAKVAFSVLGFGSTYYPNYCKFGEDVDVLLKEELGLKQILPLYKVNQQSKAEYKDYVRFLFKALELDVPNKVEWPIN